MKFEDLKLPGVVTLSESQCARAVYDQMREHYEADKKQPSPEWRLPDPPPGQQWHRTDWTADMLPEGYRPLLLGEEIDPSQDQMWLDHDSVWVAPADGKACKEFFRMRTRRPLPAPVEYVPLGPENIQPGSAIRQVGNAGWDIVCSVGANNVWIQNNGFSWDYLMRSFEILRPGSTTWEPCKKPKA